MGSSSKQGYCTKVQRYNIERSEWTFINDLPYSVTNLSAAAVIYKNRLTVVSSEHLMSYGQESDKCSLKEYENLGWLPTALIGIVVYLTRHGSLDIIFPMYVC